MQRVINYLSQQSSNALYEKKSLSIERKNPYWWEMTEQWPIDWTAGMYKPNT